MRKFKKLPDPLWKFYIMKFVRKKDSLTFHKFGITQFQDAEDRFEYEPKQYADYHKPRCVASITCKNKKTAEDIEEYFTTKYPKNISLLFEDHEHMPPKGFSGITEIYQCRPWQKWNEIYKDVQDQKAYFGYELQS